MVTGYEKEVIITSGLVQPAGIEVIADRLLVSDHANGDIIVYDISSPVVVEIGRIETNSAGIMGLTIGPDGRIWFVNATTHQLMVVAEGPVVISEQVLSDWRITPSVTDGPLMLVGNTPFNSNEALVVLDAQGRTVLTSTVGTATNGLDLSGLAASTYSVRIGNEVQRVVLAR